MRPEVFADFVKARHRGEDIRVFDDGWDHVVVAAGSRAYRFPRDAADREATPEAEAALLARLAPGCPIRVPNLELREEDGVAFAVFDLIPGVPLTSRVFAGLSPDVRTVVADDVAAFLSHLHSIPVDEAGAAGLTLEKDAPGNWLVDAYEDVRPSLTPRTWDWIAGLLARHGSVEEPVPTVIHGDLASPHLMFEPQTQRLAGVIDFADAAIGDPARDFPFESFFGRGFLQEVYRAYRLERAADFDFRRLLFEARTAVYDLQHALGLNREHNFGHPDLNEADRLRNALECMRDANP